MAMAAQDKYTVAVPGGLAFSDFRGYEDWQSVAVSKTDHAFAIILANPVMIAAYRSGIPGSGKPFPDGSKIAKVHYKPAKSADSPDLTTELPGTLQNVDFIETDSKRFPESDGWGYAAFNYNDASDTFTPATGNDAPPQSNDAKCGVACHAIAQSKDYIFTEY
jgi:Cytochrome P460